MEGTVMNNNEISFEMVLKESASLPMVRIDRAGFLKTALSPHFDEDTVQKAISVNPAYAGISAGKIRKIANSCINYETTKVTALSFAAGVPGGLAMITIFRPYYQDCTEIDLFVWLAGTL